MTTSYLTRPGGNIAYDDHGSGPLVVCLPGLGDLRGEYRFLVGPLVAQGYRVITMDLRGHGESSVGWDDYSAAAVGSDLVALLDKLAAGPALIVGTSMSAAAAIWAAAEAPQLVTGLVLIGPFIRDVPMPAAQRLMLKALLTGPWGPAAWGRYVDRLFPSARPSDHGPYRARLVRNLREPGRFAAMRSMIWASKADCEARIPEVTAPALVVMGDKDPDFPNPEAEAREVAGRLNGSVVMIEGAGHYPQAEFPEKVLPELLRFIAQIRGSGCYVA